jgi:hypothetical protein
MKRIALSVAVAAFGSHVLATAHQQTFRSTADAVLVDVEVTVGNRPVTDLRPEDFALTDNGVVQVIEDVGRVPLPLDLALVVDTGTDTRTLGLSPTIERGAAYVRSLLRPEDRGSLVTVDSQARWGQAPGDSSARGEQGTTLLDAICAAEMLPADPGRRRLIVALTAGVDTHSVIPAATRTQIFSKSEAPVYFVAGSAVPIASTYVGGPGGALPSERPPSVARAGGVWLYGSAVVMGDYTVPLTAIADATGGRVLSLMQGDLQASLRRVVDDLRTSYVLRYRPQDVGTPGWHTLSVKMVRSGSFDVRARRGYWRN